MNKLPEDRPCSKCGKSTPEVEFYYRKDRKVRESSCVGCVRQAARDYYSKDRAGRSLKVRLYRQKNFELLRQRDKSRNEKRLDKKLAYNRKSRANKNNAVGTWTKEEWNLLLEYWNYTCLSCGNQEPFIKLTADHVIPLSKGGSDYIENIQPLCGSCNSSKFTKTMDYRPMRVPV